MQKQHTPVFNCSRPPPRPSLLSSPPKPSRAFRQSTAAQPPNPDQDLPFRETRGHDMFCPIPQVISRNPAAFAEHHRRSNHSSIALYCTVYSKVRSSSLVRLFLLPVRVVLSFISSLSLSYFEKMHARSLPLGALPMLPSSDRRHTSATVKLLQSSLKVNALSLGVGVSCAIQYTFIVGTYSPGRMFCASTSSVMYVGRCFSFSLLSYSLS